MLLASAGLSVDFYVELRNYEENSNQKMVFRTMTEKYLSLISFLKEVRTVKRNKVCTFKDCLTNYRLNFRKKRFSSTEIF